MISEQSYVENCSCFMTATKVKRLKRLTAVGEKQHVCLLSVHAQILNLYSSKKAQTFL